MGSRTVNVLPWPTVDVTSMLPEWASTIRLDKCSPRPQPALAWFPGRNRSNSEACSEALMPGPVSSTVIFTHLASGRTTIFTQPKSVNLMAFPTKLVMTRRSSRISPSIRIGCGSESSKVRTSPLSIATASCSLTTSLTSFLRSKGAPEFCNQIQTGEPLVKY